MSSSDPSYTVFIRLPFPRGDFVDPPSVEWDAGKDKALWKILSKASKNSDIDWSELAAKFEVSLPFLLQQAAWLYERQLLQVRAQMRKVGASKGSAAPSPVPGSTSENAGGEMMRRTGSGGGGPRVSSALSSRKDSPLPRNDASIPSTPGRAMAPPFSRTSSANTTITSRNLPQTSPRPAHATLHRRSISPRPPRPASTVEAPSRSPLVDTLSSPEASSSESSSDSEPPAQSRLMRRQPRFTSKKQGQSEDGDEDDDEPAFMPFASTEPAHHDPSATLRGDPRHIARRTPTHRKQMERGQQSQTSDSSASSTAPVARRPDPLHRESSHRQMLAGPLSPRRTAELAGRSPISKGKGREGSDGTPSMGSSFSDLDDASVTQSALEEAMASNMQAGGGMASRMSSLSHHIRSKYL
ncbi:hypothetical protein B0J14DRAFT_594167 [Halenospora varia]|nr:hypothetical protein B0J14DRAFT_594167 [Halenospora varia]